MSDVPIVRKVTLEKAKVGDSFQALFACPNCSSKLIAGESAFDSVSTCPECDQPFQLDHSVSENVAQIRGGEPQKKEEKKATGIGPACAVCGKRMGFLAVLETNLVTGKIVCDACQARERIDQANRKANRRTAAQAIIVTSTPGIEGSRIVEYLGIDGVEIVVGTSWVSEVVTEAFDVFGARSKMFESKLRQARLHAMNLLKELALDRGADAVVGIDIDYSQFSSNRTAIIVSGTFVRIEPVG